MSTIQTQLGIVHLQNGLNLSTSTQRTSFETNFTTYGVTVGPTDETMALVGVIAPRQVILKLVSGDDLRVGLDGLTYPFRLSGLNDQMMLRLDVEGLRETSRIETVADVAGSLDTTYFVIEDKNAQTWAIGFGLLTTTEDFEITCIIAADDGSDVVALAIYDALIADTAFMELFDVHYDILVADTIVTVTDKYPHARTNIADTGVTGFTLTTPQQGAASPVIHYKSIGSSEIAVVIAPH